jgi:hypothetical protein
VRPLFPCLGLFLLLTGCADQAPTGPAAGGGSLADRVSRLEQEVQAMRADQQAMMPAIQRLVQFEGDIQTLVENLASLAEQPATRTAAAAAPSSVSSVPMASPAAAPGPQARPAAAPPQTAAPSAVPAASPMPMAEGTGQAQPVAAAAPTPGPTPGPTATAAAATAAPLRVTPAASTPASPAPAPASAQAAAPAPVQSLPSQPAPAASAQAAPPRPSPPVRPAAQTEARPPADGGMVEIYGVHLASYRGMGPLRDGWRTLQRRHGPVLGSMGALVQPLDLRDGRGVFLRLKAGPFDDRTAAESACAAIKAKGDFCQISDFDGDPVGEGGGPSS